MKILLVDDDPRFTEVAKTLLAEKKYEIDILHSAENILESIENNQYDLLILDVILPKTDGITVCKTIRKEHQELPILLLTALQGKNDKLKAFEAGADDYLVKPFDWDELLARIRALLRRKEADQISTLEWRNLKLVRERKQTIYGDKILDLTRTEYQILEVFLTNPSKLFSLNDLISKLWDSDLIPTDSTIRSHIKGLRRKLTTIGVESDFITTVYGMGYRLKEKDILTESEKDKKIDENNHNSGFISPQKSAKNTSILKETTEDKTEKKELMSEALWKIWQEYKESVFEDITLLHTYNKNLDLSVNKEVIIRKAHSLVGFLGSLGFLEVSYVCKNIENLLRNNETIDKELEKLEAFYHSLEEVNLDSSQNLLPEISTGKKKILLIDFSSDFVDNFINFGTFWDLEIDLVDNFNEGLEKLKKVKFDAIVLDIFLLKNLQERKNYLLELNKFTYETPLFIVTEESSLKSRGELSKYHLSGFLSKDLSPVKVIKLISNNLKQPEYKIVLALDDDLKFLNILKSQIIDKNIKIITLNNPLQIWEFIENIYPDLIILDLQMPEINGIEICKVIRNDLRWRKIPIIFLTAYFDDDIIDQIIAVGANDFIPKSKLELELNHRIINHLN